MKLGALAPVVIAAGAMFQSGCSLLGPGYIGPIQPPALNIPVAVSDLRALEYGNQILVAFSISNLTTEGLPLKNLRSVDLYAGPGGPGSNDPAAWSKTAAHYALPGTMPGPFEYRIPAQRWVGGDLVLRVRSTGPKGKLSQWSLPFAMSVIQPIPAPTNLKVESRKDGVRLTWQGAGPKYRVLRSTGSEAPQPIGEPSQPEFVDGSTQFGMSYQYLVLAFTDNQHQSSASQPAALSLPAENPFPPEVPTGVAATAEVNSIDLAWDINTETNFKGYNVYRSVDNEAFERVASLITAATYHDTAVQPGRMYRYQVSAVSLQDVESQRSAPVAASLE